MDIPTTFFFSFYLSIHKLMDILVVTTFWRIMNILLWTFVCTVSCGHISSILLCEHLGWELLGFIITLCWTIEEPPDSSTRWLQHLLFSWATNIRVLIPPRSLQHLSYLFFFFNYSHLSGCEIIMVLELISTMANKVIQLFVCWLAYPLWNNIYSDSFCNWVVHLCCSGVSVLYVL